MSKRYQSDCAECGRHFGSESQAETMCPKCRAKLPHCDCCGAIMARPHGYLEDRGRAIEGFGDICTGCDYEMRHKGFLHLVVWGNEGKGRKPERFLLPSGAIVNKMPA